MRRSLILLLVPFIAACDREPVASPPPDNPPLVEQIESVRAGRSVRIRLTNATFTDDDAAEVASLEPLQQLLLDDTRLTDEGLRRLAALPNLATFRFGSDHVTDAGFAHLAAMPALRHLIITRAPVTDGALQHLRGMEKLESLYLADTPRITEGGLAELRSALPQLHIHW